MTAATSATEARLDDVAQRPIRREKGRRWTSYVLPGFFWVVVVYLMLPVFVMILFGFNDVPGRVNAKWYGFTANAYRTVFTVPGLSSAIRLSMTVAIVASVTATALGAVLGLALGRYRFAASGILNYLVFLAIATPEIVLGTSLLTMFNTAYQGIPVGVTTILVAHIMFSIPFVAVTVRARVVGLDPSLEEAAKDLFASPLVSFIKVTLPLMAPGLVAGFLLAFALSVDDFVITYFVSGSATTFPLLINGAAKTGIVPQFNVVGTFLFVGGLLAAIAAAVVPRVLERRESRKAAGERLAVFGLGTPQ